MKEEGEKPSAWVSRENPAREAETAVGHRSRHHASIGVKVGFHSIFSSHTFSDPVSS
jgi:hypothetical protein